MQKALQAYWDKRAQRYARIYSNRKPLHEKVFDSLFRRAFHKRLRETVDYLGNLKGKKILDLGCGPGFYLKECLSRGASQVTGLDLSGKMIENARSLIGMEWSVKNRWTLLRKRLPSYEFEDSYDVVLAIGVLEYLALPVDYLSRLVPFVNEVLICTLSSNTAWISRCRRFYLQRFLKIPIRLYSEEQIKNITIQAGFRLVELKRLGPTYWIALQPDRKCQK